MEKLQGKTKFAVKTFLFVLGMFVSCYGIAVTTRGDLGTSPISSPAYVTSLVNPKITFGMATFVLNVIFLLGQVCMLRKKFPLIQLVQLPIAFLAGVFMDLSMFLTGFLHSGAYIWNMTLVLLGSAILGLGLAMTIYANLTYMPGDGWVKVIFETTGWNFGKIKVSFDTILVLIALAIGLLGLHEVVGLREGTLVSALTVGIFADLFLKLFKYQKQD